MLMRSPPTTVRLTACSAFASLVSNALAQAGELERIRVLWYSIHAGRRMDGHDDLVVHRRVVHGSDGRHSVIRAG